LRLQIYGLRDASGNSEAFFYTFSQ
jgi:hypothetical protein